MAKQFFLAPQGPNETINYGLLIEKVKEIFNQSNSKLVVTVALHYWQNLGKAAVDAVERVHLMTYDLNKRHSTLGDTELAVNHVAKSGIPFSKIALGVPAYGRCVGTPQE
eukprot:Pgem_evm1s4756